MGNTCNSDYIGEMAFMPPTSLYLLLKFVNLNRDCQVYCMSKMCITLPTGKLYKAGWMSDCLEHLYQESIH